jgi:hypothetical protein
MRFLRSYLRRIILVLGAAIIGAVTLLMPAPAEAAEKPLTYDDLFAHEAGLRLDGEGFLIDLTTAADYQPKTRTLHEMLHGPEPDSVDPAQLVFGAPGDLGPDITDTLLPGVGMLFDKFLETTEPGANVFFSLVDPDGKVRDGFKWVGGKVIDETGKVVENVRIVGNVVMDMAGNVIGTAKDFIKGVSGVINPGCDWWDWDTVDLKKCFQNAVGLATCFFAPAAIATTFIFEEWGCAAYVSRVLKALAAWALTKILKNLIAQLHEGLRNSVVYMANYTLIEMLGKNRAGGFNFSAVVDCNWVPDKNADGSKNDAAQACSTAGKGANGYTSKDYWFTGQYRVMRQVGLFLIIPLMMMVVMQSIIRGSLFFLLRAALVMLPIAVIGSVLLFTVAQIMMNVADDMALFIAKNTINGPEQYGKQFVCSLSQLDSDSFGFFAVFWFLMILLSMIIIFLELMLRQMGIYLTLLFIPVAFATLVYPPTVKFLKRGISLLLALIFCKVFIVAALSMGYAAMASAAPGAGAAATAGACGPPQEIDIVINQAILGVIVLLFAGFGGAKILAFTPAADAASNRLASPGEVLGMGDFTGQQLQKYGGQVMDKVGRSSQGSGVGDGVGAADQDVAGTAKPQEGDKSGAEDQVSAPGQSGPGNAPPAPDPGKPTTNTQEGQGKGVGDTLRDASKEAVSTATSMAEAGANGGGGGDGGVGMGSKESRGNSNSSTSDGDSSSKGGNGGSQGDSGSGKGGNGGGDKYGDSSRSGSGKGGNQGGHGDSGSGKGGNEGSTYKSGNGAGQAESMGNGLYKSNNAAATGDGGGSAPPPPPNGGGNQP